MSAIPMSKLGKGSGIDSDGADRREYRRYELFSGPTVKCVDPAARATRDFGQLVDISAGGVRVRTTDGNIKEKQEIHVAMSMPDRYGVSAFIDRKAGTAKPMADWTGRMNIRRVKKVGKQFEVSGELLDMTQNDRDMFRLYLSTQPLQ